MKRILSILILLHCLFSWLGALEIKSLRIIPLSHSSDTFIKKPGSFIVTVKGDERFIIFDSKASNIKIYNAVGKLVKIFGRLGMGPDEFVKPYLSGYKEPFIVIGDYGRKSFFIYKRSGRDNLQFVRKIFCLEMAHDLHFIDDSKLLVAGYKLDKNQKAYHLYEYDFKNDKHEFILPSEISYGFDSYKVYRKEFSKKLKYIGLLQYCDLSNDSIYLVCTGDIQIIKIDRKTKEYSFFGKKTGSYVQPYLTPEIRKAYDERKHRLLYKLKKGMCYVKDIFVLNSGKVGVVYFGPFKKDKGMRVMLQLYNGNGKFIKEFEVMNARATYHTELFSHFRKDKNLLYFLDTETTAAFDQFHKIYEFRIEE